VIGSEENVAADGEGSGVDVSRHQSRVCARVNSDLTEVVPEPALEKCARGVGQRRARTTSGINLRTQIRSHRSRLGRTRLTLDVRIVERFSLKLFLALVACTLQVGTCLSDSRVSAGMIRWRAHYSFRNSICLNFITIAGHAYAQLGLNEVINGAITN